MKPTIKNKAWYDQKTKELKAVTRELRAFDFMKKIIDDTEEEMRKSFLDMLMFGRSALHMSESGAISHIPLGYGLWSKIESDKVMMDWMDTKIKLHKIKMPLYKLENFKMENKYYTPKIEEFYVGFEYELEGKLDEWIKKVWYIHDFSEGRFIANLTYAKQIRVKYLDQEDIEECGWTYEKTIKQPDACGGEKFLWFILPNTKYTANYPCKSEVRLKYYPHNNTVIINNGLEYDDLNTWFQGIIKNKSELKKLMSQLNIE